MVILVLRLLLENNLQAALNKPMSVDWDQVAIEQKKNYLKQIISPLAEYDSKKYEELLDKKSGLLSVIRLLFTRICDLERPEHYQDLI